MTYKEITYLREHRAEMLAKNKGLLEGEAIRSALGG